MAGKTLDDSLRLLPLTLVLINNDMSEKSLPQASH